MFTTTFILFFDVFQASGSKCELRGRVRNQLARRGKGDPGLGEGG